MGLAGIWHGAGLQYLIFGLMHAAYLSINHAWRIFVVGVRSRTHMDHPKVGQIETRRYQKSAIGQRCKRLAMLFQLGACGGVNGPRHARAQTAPHHHSAGVLGINLVKQGERIGLNGLF